VEQVLDQFQDRAPSDLRAPGIEADEHAARASLRAQIARLEREIATAVAAAFPYCDAPRVPAQSGPRMLDLGELERVRDALAERLAATRRMLDEQAVRHAQARVLLERMLEDPAKHRWALVTSEDLGQPNCTTYHVRPRFGPIGLLLGWWRVKISSGCPLAT
jgi:hypothetical protein